MYTQMFSVLAEPNRLDIVELLYEHPYSVNELVGRLHVRQPQVSKHLKVLADAGVVMVHPEKNKRVYALKPGPFKELDKWLEKYRRMWEQRLDRLDQLLQQENDHPSHAAMDGKKEVKKDGRK